MSTVTQAAEQLQKHLEDREWLAAVAVGGEVIYIYSLTLPHKELDELSENGWNGFKIIVRETGEIHPAGRDLSWIDPWFDD